jgi:hypothetical protein
MQSRRENDAQKEKVMFHTASKWLPKWMLRYEVIYKSQCKEVPMLDQIKAQYPKELALDRLTDLLCTTNLLITRIEQPEYDDKISLSSLQYNAVIEGLAQLILELKR